MSQEVKQQESNHLTLVKNHISSKPASNLSNNQLDEISERHTSENASVVTNSRKYSLNEDNESQVKGDTQLVSQLKILEKFQSNLPLNQSPIGARSEKTAQILVHSVDDNDDSPYYISQSDQDKKDLLQSLDNDDDKDSQIHGDSSKPKRYNSLFEKPETDLMSKDNEHAKHAIVPYVLNKALI